MVDFKWKKSPRKQKIGYATVHYVAKARTMHLGSDGLIQIQIGQSYYWWKWAYGKKQISLTRPTQRQLDKYPDTVAKTWTNLQEQGEDFQESEDVSRGELEEYLGELESFREEREEAISNMEEYFRESEQLDSMKELLEEVEGLISEIEQKIEQIDED